MNKLLYFKATNNGVEQSIAEPVVEQARKFALCDYEERDEDGDFLSRYGFEYHTLQLEDCLVFSGKQDDFMYELHVYDYERSNEEVQNNSELLVECINNGAVSLKLQYVNNDCCCTDDCFVRRKGDKLVYELRLTDEVCVKVLVPINPEYHTYNDWCNDIFMLEDKVCNNTYFIFAYLKSISE